MKRFFLLSFICIALFTFSACDNDDTTSTSQHNADTQSPLKVGFIYVGAVNDRGYTYTHDQARNKLVQALGVETIAVENVKDEARVEEVATSLIKQGCAVIYATSYEQMRGLAHAAQKHPHIYFGHATGYMQFDNMSNFMGKIYEARYLSGIVAGLNTKTQKIGYVAAMPIPEVVRGINAFALGVKSVNTQAQVEVIWTGAWESPQTEKAMAFQLIDNGADIIAQHTNTHMPQVAASERGVLAIGYNHSTRELLPDTYVTAPLFHWETYYIDDVSAIINGTWRSRSYYGGLSDNMVALDSINTALVQAETVEAVEKARKNIVEESLHIFTGPIYDNRGNLQLDPGKRMSAHEMQTMIFFVDNVLEYDAQKQ